MANTGSQITQADVVAVLNESIQRVKSKLPPNFKAGTGAPVVLMGERDWFLERSKDTTPVETLERRFMRMLANTGEGGMHDYIEDGLRLQILQLCEMVAEYRKQAFVNSGQNKA